MLEGRGPAEGWALGLPVAVVAPGPQVSGGRAWGTRESQTVFGPFGRAVLPGAALREQGRALRLPPRRDSGRAASSEPSLQPSLRAGRPVPTRGPACRSHQPPRHHPSRGENTADLTFCFPLLVCPCPRPGPGIETLSRAASRRARAPCPGPPALAPRRRAPGLYSPAPRGRFPAPGALPAGCAPIVSVSYRPSPPSFLPPRPSLPRSPENIS